jgi:hypothetical protein
MPHRSQVYHPASHHHPARHANARTPHVAAAQHAAAQRQGADYTFVHAGRQVRIGPIAFWVVVGTLVIMAMWSITTATYFAFRDDVLTRLVSREAEMQFGYEDRIAELRAQIDRLSSRQLLDQEQYVQKLEQVARRQATLESRAAALGPLADPAATGSIKPPARGGLGAPARSAPTKPSPLSDATRPAPGAGRDARIDAGSPATRRLVVTGTDNIDGSLAGMQASLDRIEARHRAFLASLSACAGCWPISASTARSSRRPPRPAPAARSWRRCRRSAPPRSTASSIPSRSRARRSSSCRARW